MVGKRHEKSRSRAWMISPRRVADELVRGWTWKRLAFVYVHYIPKIPTTAARKAMEEMVYETTLRLHETAALSDLQLGRPSHSSMALREGIVTHGAQSAQIQRKRKRTNRLGKRPFFALANAI